MGEGSPIVATARRYTRAEVRAACRLVAAETVDLLSASIPDREVVEGAVNRVLAAEDWRAADLRDGDDPGS